MVPDEPAPASTFTLLLVPATPLPSRLWPDIRDSFADLRPESVREGVLVTVTAESRSTAMMSTVNRWKDLLESLGFSGAGLGVHLQLIDGQPLPPPTDPELPLGLDADGHTWLRFMPDYGAVPALWYLDANDTEGADHGLASDLLDLLPPDLVQQIDKWVEDWADWHDCDREDAVPPSGWVDAGTGLLRQLRALLEPHGYRIAARML